MHLILCSGLTYYRLQSGSPRLQSGVARLNPVPLILTTASNPSASASKADTGATQASTR